MADNAIVAIDSARPRAVDANSLGEPVDFDVRGLGRRLPRTDAPEGWIKKIERSREGLGRVFPSVDDGLERSEITPEEGKDPRACLDAQT